MILSMWSGPRNVSTALMYSFRSRSDAKVVDEPFYGHYLRVSGAPHPGAEEVTAAMESDAQVVLGRLRQLACEVPLVFVKNMAHHLAGLELDAFAGFRHALLVRDPRAMLPSLAKVLDAPSLRDTGLSEQVQILEHELSQGRQPLVIDSAELLADPAGVLAAACSRLGLEFEPSMLRWPPGPKPEDGVWAHYWYENVHRSTGFEAPRRERDPLPDSLGPLLDECLPLYERLREYALKPSEAFRPPSRG